VPPKKSAAPHRALDKRASSDAIDEVYSPASHAIGALRFRVSQWNHLNLIN
jgi:hypothetical protein